jgi:hypothetical protein
MRRRTALTGILIAAACLFALASARAFGPVDQQIRVSHMGPDGNASYFGQFPSVAYNTSAGEYMAAWYGLDNAPGIDPLEREVYVQRLSETGAPIGPRIRVSEQGPAGDYNFFALDPKVVYNPVSNEYLVVWWGDTSVRTEYEIWGQRLSASGADVGGIFRISNMGPDDDTNYTGSHPAVAVNPSNGEYLVVWHGEDNTPPLVDNELEIFGQRLTAAGTEIGADDFRISEQGADGNTASTADSASVAYNPVSNEFLVIWLGEIGVSNKFEVWAQRLSAAGTEVGGSDYQISAIGPTNDPSFDAIATPSVAANPNTGGYMAAFSANVGPPLANGKFEVWGQLLTNAGQRTNADDFRISEMGADNDPTHGAFEPAVAADPVSGEYLVLFTGDDVVSDEYEVWAQRLDGTTRAEIGGEFQVTQIGPPNDPEWDGGEPAVVVDPTPGEYLVAFDADTDVKNEVEIFARRLGVQAPTLVGTTPASPANDNNPKVRASIGSVDVTTTIDVFTNATCSGSPAVNDVPAGDLIGSGIPVTVADNSTTTFSVSASLGGHTSHCSNSISYTEVTPVSPPPPPPPPPVDRTAPVVSGFSVVPAKLRPKKASSFRFKLSERATVLIVIERVLPGRRVGKRCVAPTRKNQRRARCTRFKRTGALTFKDRPAGANKLAFRGRIGKRLLAVGAYRATNTATDAARNRSKPKRASFNVLRR